MKGQIVGLNTPSKKFTSWSVAIMSLLYSKNHRMVEQMDNPDMRAEVHTIPILLLIRSSATSEVIPRIHQQVLTDSMPERQ